MTVNHFLGVAALSVIVADAAHASTAPTQRPPYVCGPRAIPSR